MDENLHNIEDLFKGALGDDEEIPSPKVWKGVENKLDKDNVISITRKYEYLKKVALLLLLLLTGLAIHEFAKNNTGLEAIKRNEGSFDKRTVTGDELTITPTNKNNITLEEVIDTTEANQRKHHIEENSVPDKIFSFTLPKNQTTNGWNRKRKDDITDNNKTTERDITGTKPQQELKHQFYDSFKIKLGPGGQKLSDNLETQGEQTLLSALPVEKIGELATIFLNTNKLSQPLSGIKIADSKKLSSKRIKTKDVKLSRFSVGTFFSPDLAYYDLEDDNTGNQNDNAVETKKNERHEFSSSSGVFINYKVKGNWSLESGLIYSNINITVEPKTLYAQNDYLGNIKYRFNTSSGYAYLLPSFSSNPGIGDSLYTAISTHTLRYIGIPVEAKYNVKKGNLLLSVKAGLITNVLTKGRIETEVKRGADNEIEVIDNLLGLKKVFLSGLASAGVDYMLNKRMVLTVEPTWRFALNSINKNTPVKSYPRSLGLAMGVRMGL